MSSMSECIESTLVRIFVPFQEAVHIPSIRWALVDVWWKILKESLTLQCQGAPSDCGVMRRVLGSRASVQVVYVWGELCTQTKRGNPRAASPPTTHTRQRRAIAPCPRTAHQNQCPRRSCLSSLALPHRLPPTQACYGHRAVMHSRVEWYVGGSRQQHQRMFL